MKHDTWSSNDVVRAHQVVYLFRMYQQLERYLKELPVEVINSGKYDVNAMKVDFFAELARGSSIP
jgi:hypothetical protein